MEEGEKDRYQNEKVHLSQRYIILHDSKKKERDLISCRYVVTALSTCLISQVVSGPIHLLQVDQGSFYLAQKVSEVQGFHFIWVVILNEVHFFLDSFPLFQRHLILMRVAAAFCSRKHSCVNFFIVCSGLHEKC